MLRATTFFDLLVLILASTLDQTESFASIVRSVRRAGIWGKLTGQSAGFSPVPAATTQVAPSEPVVTASFQDMGSFDADAYRREMTDLVYQRSMQRSFQ